MSRSTNVKPISKPGYARQCSNADDAMMTLRTEMYAWEIPHMAEDIGVSASCLYAIRSGKTKWPRQKAFFGLIEYLELKMLLVKP